VGGGLPPPTLTTNKHIMKKTLLTLLLCIMACFANAGVIPEKLTIAVTSDQYTVVNLTVPTSVSMSIYTSSGGSCSEVYTDFLYVGGILLDGTISVKKAATLTIMSPYGTVAQAIQLSAGQNRINQVFVPNAADASHMMIYLLINASPY